MDKLVNFRLRNATRPMKALAWGFLFSVSMAYVYAIGHIFLVVGWTPKDIAVHYYGAPVKVEEQSADKKAAGEEEFSLDEMETEAPAASQTVEIGPRPSFKNLVATGHFHLFGMSSFFFGLTVLGLFTGLSDRLKTILVFTPYVSIVSDNLSFLATRFFGPAYAYLTAVSGAFMGVSFVALWCAIVYELTRPKE